MSMDGSDTEVEDLSPIEGAELADELHDEQPERLSVRDSINKAWKEHGGELPESRQPKDDRDKPGHDKQPVAAADKGAPGRKGADKAPASVPVTTDRQGTEASPAPAGSAPSGWTKEAQAEWGKLPPAVQAAITKREIDMSAGAKQLQERYGGIHKTVQTLAPTFQKLGVTPDRGLENMVSWFQTIEQNPLEGIKALAQTYKIDASKLGAALPAPAPNGSSNGQTQPSLADPRYDQLARTVAEMQHRGHQEAQNAELTAWSATKPHYQAVRQTMAQIVAGAAQMQDTSILSADGAKVDLDKVYDKAVWMVPEVRAAVLKENQEAARKARQAQVDNAKRAGSSVRPGTPGSGSSRNGEVKPKKGESVRDSIKRAFSELRS